MILDHAFAVLQHELSGLGEEHALGGALEQGKAEPVLEIRDLAA